MRRESLKLIWDAHHAGTAIQEFARGRSRADYLANLMPRSAIERQFEIIGEALNRLAQREPDVASRIPSLRGIVGFRNQLAHGYAETDHGAVWTTVETHLPELVKTLEGLLDEPETAS